jgi:hypothetical protein
MFITRAMCGLTSVTVIALCSDWSLLCISNSDWATENEAGRSVSVNGNEKTCWRDLSPIQFSCDFNYSLITHNKTPVHWTWGLLRVCAACSTPRLNLSSELRPSWNNIQDTFPTGSAQDTTRRRGTVTFAFRLPVSMNPLDKSYSTLIGTDKTLTVQYWSILLAFS